MIRFADVVLSLVGLLMLSPMLILIFVCVWLDLKSPIFRQQRVGLDGAHFTLLKFRSMKSNTPNLPTHLIEPGQKTRLGSILRFLKLDEILQLINVLRGDMSIVGPRPGLPEDHRLYAERQKFNVLTVKPGITGLAQVRGVDMSDPLKLVISDHEWVVNMSFGLYTRLIICTVVPVYFVKRILKVLG